MGLKEGGGVVAGLGTGLFRHLLQLLHSLGSGGLQPRPLRGGVLGELLLHHGAGPVIKAERTLFDALGHALAL